MIAWRQRVFFLNIGFLASCGVEHNYRVVIEFPDEASKSRTVSLLISAITPASEAVCADLQAGSAVPGDPGYRVEDAVAIDLTAESPSGRLKAHSGRRIFFAVGKDGYGVNILRGCADKKTEWDGPHQITILLQRVSTEETEGSICDSAGTCFDNLDNDGDGATDLDDSDCQQEGFICLIGPNGSITTGPVGETITVVMDGAGKDTERLVCFTDESRLEAGEILFSNDFEDDVSGFTEIVPADVFRMVESQNPLSAGHLGLKIRHGDNGIILASQDTRGRQRILLQYAARAPALDSGEFFITEYKVDGDSDWTLLSVDGDGHGSSTHQWYAHVLDVRAEDVAALDIAFRISAADDDDWVDIDDVTLTDLPEPTLSWSVLSNHFETREGNSSADVCTGETIFGFSEQGPNDAHICLTSSAQNPTTQSPENSQGVQMRDSGSYLQATSIDTTWVPVGSQLVASFFWESWFSGDDMYARASVCEGSSCSLMAGVGLGRAAPIQSASQWESSTLGRADVSVVFRIPDWSPAGTGDGVNLDDFELGWYRASHDRIGPFADQGDGRYRANLSSELPGAAQVKCIYFGTNPPLVTDGTAPSSGPLSVRFAPP